MIFVSLLIVYLVGLCVLLLTRQHKNINLFELIGLSFGLGLSVVVFMLLFCGMVFDKLTVYSVLFILAILMLMMVIKQIADSRFLIEVGGAVKESLLNLKKEFCEQKIWQKVLMLLLLLYALFKIFMAFSINVSHPTMAEDGINGWDIKTKVFFENKSLVLDVNDPEFYGGVGTRNNYAPLADLFFILLYKDFPVGLSNIISPLMYLNFCLLLFGIFLRKTNIKFACLSVYIFLSLPLIFIHSFTSYFNLPTAYYLFFFAFYLSDQVLSLKGQLNKSFVLLLLLFSFLGAGIRSENVYLVFLILIVEIAVLFFMVKRHDWKAKAIPTLAVFITPVVVYLINLYFRFLDPATGGHIGEMKENILILAFKNIFKEGVFIAPYKQTLFHSDYNLLFLLFVVMVILMFVGYKKCKDVFMMFFVMISIAGVFILTLYAYLSMLGLISHFGVRYMLAISPFALYVVLLTAFNLTKNGDRATHE